MQILEKLRIETQKSHMKLESLAYGKSLVSGNLTLLQFWEMTCYYLPLWKFLEAQLKLFADTRKEYSFDVSALALETRLRLEFLLSDYSRLCAECISKHPDLVLSLKLRESAIEKEFEHFVSSSENLKHIIFCSKNSLHSEACLFGMLYVMEGSRLGGKIISVKLNPFPCEFYCSGMNFWLSFLKLLSEQNQTLESISRELREEWILKCAQISVNCFDGIAAWLANFQLSHFSRVLEYSEVNSQPSVEHQYLGYH